MLLFHLLLRAYCAIGIWRMNYGFAKFDIKIGRKKKSLCMNLRRKL